MLYGESIGRLTELHPMLAERGRAAVLDIDLDRLMQLCRRDRKYEPLPRFPSSAFDLSVIVPQREYAGHVQAQLQRFGGEELKSIEFVRQYSGPPLPEGTKSVSFRLTVSATDRTLSSDEIGATRQRIIDGMRQLGYELRV
jgi:phenylalanyl-tRNA synthetase beta chain